MSGDVNDVPSFWRVREALKMSFSFSLREKGPPPPEAQLLRRWWPSDSVDAAPIVAAGFLPPKELRHGRESLDEGVLKIHALAIV
jgi:hypothetical protein